MGKTSPKEIARSAASASAVPHEETDLCRPGANSISKKSGNPSTPSMERLADSSQERREIVERAEPGGSATCTNPVSRSTFADFGRYSPLYHTHSPAAAAGERSASICAGFVSQQFHGVEEMLVELLRHCATLRRALPRILAENFANQGDVGFARWKGGKPSIRPRCGIREQRIAKYACRRVSKTRGGRFGRWKFAQSNDSIRAEQEIAAR